MRDIKLIFDLVFRLLNTRLYFSPFSFTVLQALLGTLCLGIVIRFVIKIFDS